MRRKFWQTEKFRDLQKQWEEKLKKSGFIDAESRGKLCQNAANSYRTQVPEIIEGKQRYFELLSHFFHEEEFLNDIEKYVMERRSEGISIRDIARELKVRTGSGNRETVRQIVRIYEKKWSIHFEDKWSKKKP